MRVASSLFEGLGLFLIAVALYFVDWRALVAYLGVVAILLGFVIDPPRRGSE